MAAVTDEASQANWTADLERSWQQQHRMSGAAGPRESIRPDRVADAGDFATRRLKHAEHQQVQTFVPNPDVHRRIITLDPRDEAKAGDTTGREIEIEGLIAKGGMGAVYRGRQVSLDREVAVKRLTPNSEMPDCEALFESEACITAVLDHPNIVPVYDLGVDQHDRLFYSMKHVRGRPWDVLLDDRIPQSVGAPAGQEHDLRAHLEILIEVANALAFAHSRGIIHRDIKPQNVIVGSFGEVLLVDWGLAAAVRPVEGGGRIQDLDQVLITCGTPAYMPPEIALGLRDHVGPWTDVYMMGAVLFEVLYGLVPHDESTAVDTVQLASANQWQFPEQIAAELRPYHEVFKEILTCSLATEPTHRFADGGAFAEAMGGALRHLDSAGLAAGAIALYGQVQGQEAAAQQARTQGNDPAAFGSVENRYQMLARAIAGLEQALSSWDGNNEARHYLVESHLLHAHISIVAGDLTQAEAHLQSLDATPFGAVLDAAQTETVAKLRRRVREKIAYKTSRRRRALGVTIAAGLLAVTVVVGTLVAALLIGRARNRVVTERNHLAQLLIASATDRIEAELHRLFDPVRGALLGTRDWVEAGRLDSDDPKELSAYFIPLVDGYPVISSIMRADDRGQEFLLIRDGDGWLTRTTTPNAATRFAALDRDGKLVRAWEEQVDYDAHLRPWYVGAKSLGADAARDAVHWTEPYLFFTRQEAGITASMPIRSPAGRQFVIGVDVPLSDLSTHTMDLSDSELGKIFVVTDDDRVVALPRAPQFADPDARKAAALQPIGSLGDPVPALAVAQWHLQGTDNDGRFRLEAQGQPWWGSFRRFELGPDRGFWIAVVLPERDFVVAESE